MTTLIFCADDNIKYAEIARRYIRYGAQLPNPVYFPPDFVDQNWLDPVRDEYMAELAKHRPALATVLDFERADQFNEVMAWAEQAAGYVGEAVIVIPGSDTDKGVRCSTRQIGALMEYPDGCVEWSVFSLPELWNELKDAKPVQRRLFA